MCSSEHEQLHDLKERRSLTAGGQLAWREEADAATPDAGNEWLGEVGVWSRRDLLDRATARSMLTAIAGSLVAGGWSAMSVRKARGTLRKVPWLAAAAIPGGVGLRMVGQARFAIAAGCWWVARASRLGQRAAYRALWSAAFERGFCEFVSRRAVIPAWEDVTAESRPLAAFSPGAMAGVHAAGRDGRATGTVVLLRLRFPAGDHSLRLAWRLPVPAAATAVSVFFNGRRVPATAVDADEHSLVVRLERMRCRDDGRQELSLTLCGFPSGAEGRLLGATLQAVSIHPLQMG